MNGVALAIGTWFGCGYFPWGPGTAGSLAAVLIVALLGHFGLGRGTLALLIVALLLPAVWAASRTARIVGREDPGLVVVDEVLGQWVALLAFQAWNWKILIAGFLLFRLFDIWKPFPVRRLEQLPEGTGIVADDLGAGLYAAFILYIGGVFGIL